MKAWGDAVVDRLAALGLDVTSCAVEGDRAAFVPDGRLALRIEPGRLEVSLVLPPREVAGLRARLADAERALELATAVEALPEQFTMGDGEPSGRVPASSSSTDDLRALFARLEREDRSLWLGWTVPRSVALAHATLLDEQLEDALVVLGGLLALVAWVPAAAFDPRTSARRDRRDRVRHDERREGSGASATAPDSGRTHRRDERSSRGRDREHEQEGETDAEPEHAGERESAAPRPTGRTVLRGPLRPGLRRPGAAASAPVAKGGRVRVLEGPFAGKVGVVQELDGKGGARVMLGLLAVRVDVKDLVAWTDGRSRPLLSSSHRKFNGGRLRS
jgi:hypothetical protein